MLRNNDKHIYDIIDINNSQINFIVSKNLLPKYNLKNTFFNILLDKKSLINSFECENDSTLGAGEHSFLIYGGQHLTLYNIDGILHQISWNTNKYDSIKQIRWSSYYRSYLIMTARLFSLYSYESLELRTIIHSDHQLQLFTCHYKDLWLICLFDSNQTQKLIRYDLSRWERMPSDINYVNLEDLGIHRTDYICAIENDQQGQCLAFLIAEKNRNITVGIQRQRRLVLISIINMFLIRTVYFNTDDVYFTLTAMTYRNYSQTGWLLGKCFDKKLTFVDNKSDSILHTIEYESELRNLAVTIDGRYFIIRTINSLDIFQIY